MIRKNDTRIAEGLKTLYVEPLELYTHSFAIGNVVKVIDGKVTTISITDEDIKEGYRINIENEDYFIDANSYGDLVTKLIRIKYSLDQELALIANTRNGDYSGEEEFQSWRYECKLIAKSLTNE